MTCPHPEKRRYGSKGDALQVIRAMYRTGNGNPDLHPYRCQCGAWHISHDVRHFGRRVKVALKSGRTRASIYRRRAR